MSFLKHPRTPSAFSPTRAHCWSIVPRAAFQQGGPQPVLVQGVILAQVQDLVQVKDPAQVKDPECVLVELLMVLLFPSLHIVQVLLKGGTAFTVVIKPTNFEAEGMPSWKRYFLLFFGTFKCQVLFLFVLFLQEWVV